MPPWPFELSIVVIGYALGAWGFGFGAVGGLTGAFIFFLVNRWAWEA